MRRKNRTQTRRKPHADETQTARRRCANHTQTRHQPHSDETPTARRRDTDRTQTRHQPHADVAQTTRRRDANGQPCADETQTTHRRDANHTQMRRKPLANRTQFLIGYIFLSNSVHVTGDFAGVARGSSDWLALGWLLTGSWQAPLKLNRGTLFAAQANQNHAAE